MRKPDDSVSISICRFHNCCSSCEEKRTSRSKSVSPPFPSCYVAFVSHGERKLKDKCGVQCVWMPISSHCRVIFRIRRNSMRIKERTTKMYPQVVGNDGVYCIVMSCWKVDVREIMHDPVGAHKWLG